VWTGNKKVEFSKIEETLEVKRVKLASPKEVQTNLGVEIGALAPFGYQYSYPVVVDSDLYKQAELFINPGVHDKTIKLLPQDLHTVIEKSAQSLHIL
jgi:prolyl-tRNA editing enzyme YbaK/EbsC (Cys-tRNA(Pro) deacylase)